MLSKPTTTSMLAERLLPLLGDVLSYVQGISQSAWQKLVSFVLSLLIVMSLVQWVWLLLPEAGIKPMPAVAVSQPVIGKQGQVDIGQLQSYNLFGAVTGDAPVEQAKAVEPQKTVDAAPTRLKLLLLGIVMANNPEDASAIIKYQGKEEQYAIGDRLPVGRVVLSQIHADHVIIENAGRYESLWLFDGESTSSTATTTKPANNNVKKDMRADKSVGSMARNYRNRLYKNPSSLADVIRISPKQVDGELQGYRVSPGRDKQQFQQLGLKSNDVVTSINGIALDDPGKAVEVYKIMRSAAEATFVIDRQGETVELIVSLDDS